MNEIKIKTKIALLLASVLLLYGQGDGLILAVDSCSASSIRWASSSNRIYITGNVVCTLSDIKSLSSDFIPLSLVDESNKIWFLGANIVLQNGATLKIYSDGYDGDVNNLRLKSNNDSSNNYISITADWGKIDIKGSKINSWDESAGGPDTNYSNGRAFIRVRSQISSTTLKESRMDIEDSEISYLGFNSSESYGLSWKLLAKTLNDFNTTGVYGDVKDNKIHHNYFGAYTYGAQAMNFIGNEVYENIVYGIDPHDDSDYMVIDSNYVHHNGKHGIICSKRCDHITITNNNSSYNKTVGIFLHRLVDNSLIKDNITNNNVDSGIVIFDSYNNLISGNTSKNNEKGIRLSVGSANNIIEGNDFSNNSKYGIFTYMGSDVPLNSSERMVNSNIFRNNTISYNVNTGIRLNEAIDNIIENNNIFNNEKAVYTVDTRNNTFFKNSLTANSKNYYYEGYDSQNIIKDDGSQFSFKVNDSLSNMTVINYDNYFLWNSKKIGTDFYFNKAVTLATREQTGSSIVLFNNINFKIKPDSGKINASLDSWDKTSSSFGRKWIENIIVSPLSAEHNIGGFIAGNTYKIYVNGSFWQTVEADSSGLINFTYSDYSPAGSAINFEIN